MLVNLMFFELISGHEFDGTLSTFEVVSGCDFRMTHLVH